jgi:hypothetical protein
MISFFSFSILLSILSLSSISYSPNWPIKPMNLSVAKAFVMPSATIWVVFFHSIWSLSDAYFWRSQWLWISTCCSLVCSFADSSYTSRIVCRLSHCITSGSSRSSYIALNSLLRKMAFLAVWDNANSSALVLDVVTVSCLLALQAIGPPNSVIT